MTNKINNIILILKSPVATYKDFELYPSSSVFGGWSQVAEKFKIT